MFSSSQVLIVFLPRLCRHLPRHHCRHLHRIHHILPPRLHHDHLHLDHVQLPTDGGGGSAVSVVKRHLRRGTHQREGGTLEVIFLSPGSSIGGGRCSLTVSREAKFTLGSPPRCESEECLMRNSGNVSPVVRQSPQVEDMGCQVGGGGVGGVGGVGGGGGGGQEQAEEEEQMLGSQLAELQQKLDRFVPRGNIFVADNVDYETSLRRTGVFLEKGRWLLTMLT